MIKRKNKQNLVCRIICMLFCFLCTTLFTYAADYDFKVNDIYYRITSEANKEVGVAHTIVSGALSPYKGDIVIPSVVKYKNNDYTVMSIEKKAFIGPYITSIKLPSSLVTIKDSCFLECYRLKTVELPKGLDVIGNYAFAYSGIKDINIPENVKTNGEYNQEIKGKTNVEIIPVSA